MTRSVPVVALGSVPANPAACGSESAVVGLDRASVEAAAFVERRLRPGGASR
jgi:hypothetical protein